MGYYKKNREAIKDKKDEEDFMCTYWSIDVKFNDVVCSRDR